MEDIIAQKQINVGFSHRVIFRSMNSYQKLMHKPENNQLILYDGKTVYDYNYRREQEAAKLNFYQFTNQKSIVNATFVNKYKVYMVLCEDWRLYVFRRNFDLLNKFPFDSKYSVGMHYLEESDQILLIGVDSIELVKLGITTNIHQSKFLTNIKFEIEMISSQSITQILDWNKGYFITGKGEIDDDQYLFIWSLKDLVIYSMKKLDIIYKMQNLGKREKSISEILFMREYRYVVSGYNDGTIKVWTLSNNKKIIHTFDGHTRQIDSFTLHTDKRMFWSASEDMTIRLWNLDTFTNMYTFHLQGSFHKILLINHQKFIAEQEGEICIGNISSENELICKHYGNIVAFDKSYKNYYVGKVSGNIEYLTFTLDNNSGMSIYVPYFKTQENLHDLSKIPISVFYPPPKSNNIIEIISCPYEENIFYMLVEGGDICRYRLEKDTGIVEDTYSSEQIMDADCHPLNQKATTIKFLKAFPPQIDVEINDIRIREHEEKVESSFENLTELFLKNQLMTLGCSKGSIVFLNINDMKKVYARFSFHREQILQIDSVYSSSHQDFLLVSLCEEYRIKVVKFHQNKIQCIQGYDLKQNIRMYSCFDQLFLLNLNGEFEVFSLNQDADLVCKQSDEGNFHESKIISIDFLPAKQYVLTAAEDNKVKLWHMEKILLAQVNIYENLCGAYFASDDGDILISHNGKISLIKEFHFGIKQSQIEQINDKVAKQDRLIISIDEFYNTLKFQQYQSNIRLNYSSKGNRNVNFVEEDQFKKNSFVMMNPSLISLNQTNQSGLYMNLSQSQINPANMNVNAVTATHHNSGGSNNYTNFASANYSILNTKKSNKQLQSQSPSKGDHRTSILVNGQKRMHSLSMIEERDQDQSKVVQLTGQNTNRNKDLNKSSIEDLNISTQKKQSLLNSSFTTNVRRSNNFSDNNQKTAFQNNSQSLGMRNNNQTKSPKYIQSMPQSLSPFSHANIQVDKQKKTKPMTIVEQQYAQKMQAQQQNHIAQQKQQQKQANQTRTTTFIDSQNSQIDNYKKLTALPKIGPSNHRPLTIIEKFTNEKLLSKKVLTRRDITLNKIIMRNLVRNQQAIQAVYETQIVQGMKMNNNSSFYSKNDKSTMSIFDKK
ncbi:WD domain, G-beta repeat protein (macronuclear) [Tetrahymena thermophila SB210]|uniref:WD domain, G-beta repeat protein n=1 Tax=Tetrahymena thermophila (strain SB210) TaxID=312017 RepID=I7LXV1_TETTS|nr:WD domain, G-beta repeat protein [Tetrahymena thermophila SB210]EAS06246.2 WD domain, G-beta repeat protein [Tetrahymena thermophila SB210]|eukprot:XP_001026491.2 WD domain, G-beta repeat protein [Tetrahymena thermophila SB210]